MSKTIAVVVDPSVPERFVLREFDHPTPTPNQAFVRVHAVSINRGEVRYSMTAPAGRRPGWDFAGVVDQPAADGTGAKAGARVVGMLNLGSWSQHVAVPTNALAELPDSVSFEVAATLPVAGLTALHSLYKGGFLVNKPVLITGAAGGTGDFLIQLAKLGGARVVALARNEKSAGVARGMGADEVVVGDDITPAAKFGPYALVVDSIGGKNFGKCVEFLATRGTLVSFGTSAGNDLAFTGNKFYLAGSASIYGLILFHELNHEPAADGLKLLADLVAQNKLKPRIDVVESWTKVAEVAQALTDRKYHGKAVLRVE